MNAWTWWKYSELHTYALPCHKPVLHTTARVMALPWKMDPYLKSFMNPQHLWYAFLVFFGWWAPRKYPTYRNTDFAYNLMVLIGLWSPWKVSPKDVRPKPPSLQEKCRLHRQPLWPCHCPISSPIPSVIVNFMCYLSLTKLVYLWTFAFYLGQKAKSPEWKCPLR